MEYSEDVPTPKRGTALLVMTILVLASFTMLIIIPHATPNGTSTVRVAVIDSGIDQEYVGGITIIASKSFVNVTYGYQTNDTSIKDSRPEDGPHGTYVAAIIATNAPFVGIINAKVVSSNNRATEEAIIAAIHWAVSENCDIINLSLGGQPTDNDPLKDAVEWAFQQGVVIVAAAGNDGQGGVSGSSIDTPAVYPEVIAVGGVDESGRPYYYSGRGPLINRRIKPDISALGSYIASGGKVVYGTSFAAPRITAGAAQVISYCKKNGWQWTPGMVKAVMMATAEKVTAEVWEVGAGLLNIGGALRYLDDTPKKGILPLVAWVSQEPGPYNFERWFLNTTIELRLTIITSSNTSFHVYYSGSGSPWVRGPSVVYVNQTQELKVNIEVISNKREDLQALISFANHEYLSLHVGISFTTYVPFLKVAFDFSHTNWWIDSVYGQFREFYHLLGQNGVAVEEIRSPVELTLQRLQKYNAVIVLDPCTWVYGVTNHTSTIVGSLGFRTEELQAYKEYWNSGGNVFIIGLSNTSIDVAEANRLTNLFNVSFNFDSIPSTLISIGGIVSTTEITKMIDHPVTQGIASFDYVGCSLNYSGRTYEIAWTQVNVRNKTGQIQTVNRTVMVGLESTNGSRLLIAGSNFFIDNWALNNRYKSQDDRKLALQAIYWLAGISG